MLPYERSTSNEIASSTQLNQMRKLQTQLGALVQDDLESSIDDTEIQIEHSTRSTVSGGSSWGFIPECYNEKPELLHLQLQKSQLLPSLSSASDETLLISHQQTNVPKEITTERKTEIKQERRYEKDTTRESDIHERKNGRKKCLQEASK